VILRKEQCDNTGEERIAAAMLQVKSTSAVRWELAISQEGPESDTPLSGDAVADAEESASDYTNCVDSGLGRSWIKQRLTPFSTV
jgi:hypothetical protein